MFKFKQKITGNIDAESKKDVEIVPLKYFSKFWRTLEMPLTYFEINLILTWSGKCVLSNDAQGTTFAIPDTKLYVPVVNLTTHDNAKLLQQLKPGFKKAINWKSNKSRNTRAKPIFRLLNWSKFENTTDRTVHTKYYLQTVEIKDVMVIKYKHTIP